MDHASRVVEHVTSLLGSSQYARLISNSIMNDVPTEEFESVFNALDEVGLAVVWQFQILEVYRP